MQSSYIILVLVVGVGFAGVIGAILVEKEPEIMYIEIEKPSIQLTSAEIAVMEAIEEDKRITEMYERAYPSSSNNPMVEYWDRAKLQQLLP